jgi:precorrin-3B synthase
VSGCAKGCAHPVAAPLTIVGTAQGCGLIKNSTAGAHPDTYMSEEDLMAETVRFIRREPADA